MASWVVEKNLLINAFTLQGQGVTIIHSLSQEEQVSPNTPTSVDVPFYEVRQHYNNCLHIFPTSTISFWCF